MGCFLGCFGDAKDRKSKNQKPRRASPRGQKRPRAKNDQQQSILLEDQNIQETPPTNLVSELQNKPKEEEKLSPSPKKRVTFSSNITTHHPVSVFDSTDSLAECQASAQKEKVIDLKSSEPLNLESGDGSVTSSVGSYPSNHRYHNAIDSDGEAEDYGDSDLDDDLDESEDEEGFEEYDKDDVDCVMSGQEVWSESILISSAESRVETNHSTDLIDEEVQSHLVETWQLNEEIDGFGSKTNARDRRDYVNSVLNPVENITQWKSVKSKETSRLSKPQKENMTSYTEPTLKNNISSHLETKSDQWNKRNQEMAVDTSLSNWLVTQGSTPSKNNISSHLESVTSGNTTISKGSHSMRSFEDRPILGALTVDELKQISVSSSPKKSSPIRNPDDMPIIGGVGTYWSHSKNFDSTSSAYKGIPNTTSKYREDNIVRWQSTPFETRLERALNQGSAEA